MDIKDFEIKYIDDFCLFYNGAKNKFGKSIETDNIKKQTKIKNWMLKVFILEQDYPENITDFLKNLDSFYFRIITSIFIEKPC